MVQSVKTFPLREQIEIKGKVFHIVNSTEMRIALMNSISSKITNNHHKPDYPALDSGGLLNYLLFPVCSVVMYQRTRQLKLVFNSYVHL